MEVRIIGNPFTGEDNRYHYLYLIHNNINGHYYYGVHNCDDLYDGYCGSGTRLKMAFQKYGKESFTKYIIEFFQNRKELLNKEAEIVNEELLNDPKCYNLVLGGGSPGCENMVLVRDENHDILRVSVNDPGIGTKYQHINKGYTMVKKSDGSRFNIRVRVDDPRLQSGELVGISKGYACMKDREGNILKVNKDDPRIKSGELISIVKDTVSVCDANGNNFRTSKDDPRIKSGELHYHTEGRLTVVDKYGNTCSVKVDDPRIKSGELISVNLNRKYINKNGKNKMIYEKDLQYYLDDGWKLGIYKCGSIIVNKNGERRLIKPSDLQYYLDNGWSRGQGKTKSKSGRPKKITNS